MILLCSFISIAVFYLAIFHKWVTAISQYKVLYKKAFKCCTWKQKVIINKSCVELYVNDECTNTLKWDDIKKVTLAKSSISLKRNSETDRITLFDDSYVKGNREETLNFIIS